MLAGELKVSGRGAEFSAAPASAGHITDAATAHRLMLGLIEAKDRAEEALKLQDKFLVLVTHDLRSPLSSMIGLLKLLDDSERFGPLAETQEKLIRQAVKNGEGLLGMIDRLLDISRLKSGGITVSRERILVNDLVESVANSLSHLAETKGVTVINNVRQGTFFIADSYLLGEVIRNLLSNAIKFCRKGDSVEVFIPQGRRNVLAVKDTGVGVKSELLENLFRHEVKTTMPGTEGEKGTGLGLPFCRDIMEAHGGSLSVESSEGEGSVFYAELPLDSGHSHAAAPLPCDVCPMKAK